MELVALTWGRTQFRDQVVGGYGTIDPRTGEIYGPPRRPTRPPTRRSARGRGPWLRRLRAFNPAADRAAIAAFGSPVLVLAGGRRHFLSGFCPANSPNGPPHGSPSRENVQDKVRLSG